ncbi:MAG: hypothetical protein LBK06_04850 [Planctomycetaceae bacterium]|nr:hypothetical protein [Planctomycetaceae bacterium]
MRRIFIAKRTNSKHEFGGTVVQGRSLSPTPASVYAQAVSKFTKLNTAAQQREAVV